ncbi:MAG: SGNH/GDSL hydrolase family protein [Terracoccus sp.]
MALVLFAVVGVWAGGASPSGPAPSLATASQRATTAPPSPASTTQASTGPQAGDPLTLVGLGDSVPSASGCACTGYVELLGQSLHHATRRPVVVHNDSMGGATTSDLEQALRAGQTAADLSHADLVTVEIGANDFDVGRVDDPACLPVLTSPCWTDTLTGLRTGLTDIISGIRDIDTNPDVRIALIGYWNVTVDGAVGAARGGAFVSGSDALTRAVNATIAAVATSSHSVYVDAYSPLKGTGSLDPTSALLDDGDHLDAEGHAILAKAVLDALAAAGVVTMLTPAP